MIGIEGVAELKKTIDSISLMAFNKDKLNMQRADRFRKATISSTKTGRLELLDNTQATQKIQGLKHNPLYWRGYLLKYIKNKAQPDKSVDSGYFSSDSGMMPNSKLSVYRIAVLQTTGYRIPLQGDKGERVRRFLSVFGIYPKKTRQWLIVSPRPFLFNSANQFDDMDIEEIQKYFDRVWDSL